MSENRSASPPPQGPDPSPNQSSVDFVTALLGDGTAGLWIAASKPKEANRLENGGYYSPDAVAAMLPTERHHLSSARYREGLFKRSEMESNVIDVPFFVVDDIGVRGEGDTVHVQAPGAKLDVANMQNTPEPTWVIETSKGNHQYGFQLEPAMTHAEAHRLREAMRNDPRYKAGIQGSIGQYFRLPTGVNSKEGREDFPTRLVSFSGQTYTFAQLVQGFGLSLGTASAPANVVPLRSGGWGEQWPVDLVRKVVETYLPNDGFYASHDDWFVIGCAIKGACGDEGFPIWEDWCAKQVQEKREPQKTWEDIGEAKASGATLRKEVEKRHGKDSDAYRAVQGMIAETAFTAVEDGTIPGDGPAASPDERKEEAAKKRFHALLEEARRLTPVPTQHRGDKDRNWLTKTGEAVDVLTSTGTPSASATIFKPHVKGLLSMLAGPPGKHKSTLALAQSMAIAYADKDLLRDGGERLQFPGDVFYVCNEDAKNTIERRLRGLRKHHNLLGKPAKHGVFPVSSALMMKNGSRGTTIECERIVEAMVKRLRNGHAITAVFVDTLPSSVIGFDENSSEMMEVMALLEDIADAFWCSVVLIHHGTKAGWDNEDGRSLASAARGFGGITGTVRGLVTMVDPTDDEKKRFLTFAGKKIVVEFIVKNSDGRQNVVACFYELHTVEIDVLGAETGLPEKDWVPVLVPIVMPSVFGVVSSAADEKAWTEKLRNSKKALRRYGAGATGAQIGGDSVHHVLGVSNQVAWEIIEKLAEKGLVTLVKNKHERTETVVVRDEESPF